MHNQVWERIEEACAPRRGAELTRFLMHVCSVKQPSVSRWRKGVNDPSLANCIEISKATGFTVQWIYTGQGKKRTEPEDSVTSELIALLESLPDEDREEVLRYARFRGGA